MVHPPPHLTGRAGATAPRPSVQPLTFIDGPWASPALPNPSLLSTGPGPARSSPTPHFYQRALGRPGPPETFTFIDRPWAGPALPKPSLLSTGPGPARPSPTPHFYRQGPGQPGLGQPLTSIGRPRPLTSIGWPWPRSRAPGGSSSGRAARAGGGQARLTNPLLTLAPRRARARRPPGAHGKSAGGYVAESSRHMVPNW